MADAIQPRRLASIVALDVAGYSERAEADEARTTAKVAALHETIYPARPSLRNKLT